MPASSVPFSPIVANLLHRIPLAARTILDVGCGHGALAAAYRPLNPIVRWLGVERDLQAAQTALTHCDALAIGDVEADPMPFELTDGIDCVIYGSILQHLLDPWGLIREHAKALTPDGVMLLCLPNPDHWRMAEWLLRGSQAVPPPPAWFSAESTYRQIARAGLVTCDISELRADYQTANQFAAVIAPALSELGVDPMDFAKRSAASHLVWRVRKEWRERVVVAGTMLTPVGGVSHVRILYPFHAIATDPSVMPAITEQIDPNVAADGSPRIFILHRPALVGPGGLERLKRLSDAGYLVITEFDDHPDHFSMMQMGGEMSFMGVHALQTSTAAMADVLRKYNPEIAIFPNAIVSLPEVRNFTDPDSLTLFFGALNREMDWQHLMPVLNDVARLAGDRLRFEVIHDQSFFDALETPHKTFTPTCDYDTYLRILGGCEISFMPLSDTPFNRCKSDLKFIEAASCRVASVASAIVYQASIEESRTGLLFRDAEELRLRLLSLVALPEFARSLGDSAREYVRQHRMLAYQVAPRIGWYRSLWSRRAGLDQQMRDRMGQAFGDVM